VPGSQREELHEISRAALRPSRCRDWSRIHEHLEASEHPYLELAHQANHTRRGERYPDRPTTKLTATAAVVSV
jgi:hypothetical protein